MLDLPTLTRAATDLALAVLPLLTTCAVIAKGIRIALKARRSEPVHLSEEQARQLQNIRASYSKKDIMSRAVPRTPRREFL